MRLALILLVAWLAAACSRGGSDETVLEFWAMGREGEVVQELVPEFERENPGIRVKVQQLPVSSAHEKLLTAFAGDVLPDAGQIGNTWLPELAALGAVDRLEPAVAASPVVDKADYFPGIWSTNVVDGALYGIPWYVDTRLLFYRKDLLAQAGYDSPPKTWAEWAEAMAEIKRRGGGDVYGALLPLNEYEPLLALALQQDQPLLRDGNTRGNFRSPGFVRTLEFYDSLFDRGLAPVTANTQIGNLYEEFDRGYFSFYVTGPWNIGEFKRRLPPERQDDWMTAPLPGPVAGQGGGPAGGSSLVVFSRSPRKQAAWKFIEFLSRTDIQARFYALSGNLPARRSGWEAGGLANDPYAAAFKTQLERVEPSPPTPEWERIAQEVRIVSEDMVRNNIPAKAAAAEMDRRADRILEKRRWMVARDRAEARGA